MYYIAADNVDMFWGSMATGLSRALDKTALGLTWGIDDAYEAVKQGRLFGFYQPESGYSGLYAINQTPKAKVLYWFWSGKDPANQNPLNPLKIVEHLKSVAKIVGCELLQAEGRPGFKQWAKSTGFTPDSHNWIQEV